MGNPFLSQEWQDAWYANFSRNKERRVLFLGDESFYLLRIWKFLPIYTNGGMSKTNLIETVNATVLLDQFLQLPRPAVVVLFDVPTNGHLSRALEAIRARFVFLYPAYMVSLNGTLDDILQRQFDSKKRTELRKFRSRLAKMGTLRFEVLEEDKDVHRACNYMHWFLNALERRYKAKGEYNRNLLPAGRKFLYSVVHNCLGHGLNLSVLLLDNEPISMAISYAYDYRLIYSVPVFDIALEKFNPGHIHLMYLLEWAIERGYKVFDFSKGQGVYKLKWSDTEYALRAYVFSVGSSIIETVLVWVILGYLRGGSFLRKHGWNIKIRKFLGTLLFSKHLKPSQHKNVIKLCSKPQGEISRILGDDQLLTYSSICDLPHELKKAILDEVYRLYGRNNQLWISRINSCKIRLFAPNEIIDFEVNS